MNRMRLAGVVLAVVLATGSGSASAALNGEAAYLAEQGPIQRSGFWGSGPGIEDRSVLSIGYTACSFYARGMSDAQVLQEMVPWADELDTASRAYQTGLQGMRTAHRCLCPQY